MSKPTLTLEELEKSAKEALRRAKLTTADILGIQFTHDAEADTLTLTNIPRRDGVFGQLTHRARGAGREYTSLPDSNKFVFWAYNSE